MSRTFVWRKHEKVIIWRVFAPVCRIFAWRGERSPRENTPNRRRKGDSWKMSYFCVAGRKAAMWKHEKVTIWRVFAWRLFAPPGKDTTNRGENAKGRHAKTRQMMTFSCFRMVTFRPATRKYATFHALRFWLLFCRIFAWRGERSPCENPTKTPFGGFSRGYLSRFRPENTFIRHGINQPPYKTVSGRSNVRNFNLSTTGLIQNHREKYI